MFKRRPTTMAQCKEDEKNCNTTTETISYVRLLDKFSWF